VVTRPGTALLAVDVGNTNTVLGLYEDGQLLRHWRLTTRRDETADEIVLSVRGLLQASGREEAPHGAPAYHSDSGAGGGGRSGGDAFGAAQAHRQLDDEHGAAGGGVLRPEAAAMLLDDAVGDGEPQPAPLIVVDFGTATTFDVVTERGEYAGGVIVPGIAVSADALFEKPRGSRAWKSGARTA
jgi:type III pantothenate kinase